MPSKSIMLIAGEASGDLIASKMIKHLPKDINLSGVGGQQMQSCGFKSMFDIADISVMGFVEVIKSLPLILKRINQTINYINENKPNLIVTFDSPGFAKAVVKKLRSQGYTGKIIHVVAPTVWAYKEKRAKTFAKYFDAICCLFPFEPPYFEKHGLKSYFVGNISIENELMNLKQELANLHELNSSNNGLKIAITLGSRKVEIKRHLPIIKKVMLSLSKWHSNIEYILPTLPNLENDIKDYLQNSGLKYTILSEKNAINKAIQECDIAIAKSGTNTLQFLANFKPIVVYYKLNWLSYLIIKCMLKVKFANIINIMANKMVIPELIQGDATPENIENEVKAMLNSMPDTKRKIAEHLLQMLPSKDEIPSEKLANTIFTYLN